MFGGGKPVTAFRFFFKGKLIDGEQTAADIDIRRAIDLDVADYINVTSLPEVTLPITRSNSKKIRENVRRLPHEVLGRGEGGSERIREDPRGLGRGRVELRLS